ncbi:DUF2281 domain-containing protein [Kamptonema formosum]|uniref:DUF2281 domain-containing protein n=1 Tax=Kamptonema formosum TaxID=331992 RepID=UPI00034691A8|nr:DUF2281 domain-containing protein [Oscillatoria sp. PCC 10802]
MSQTVEITQTIVEKLKTLPPEKQHVVLEFVEFLQSKTLKQELLRVDGEPVSALTLAGNLVGCLEGPGDLSIKKRELKGHKAE